MSPVSNERAKILEKIVKLLALAEGSTFEGEGANARRLAEELMAKHDVSMEETLSKEEIEQDTIDTGVVTPDVHYVRVFNRICKFNGILLVRSKGYKSVFSGKVEGCKLILAGRKSDREAALYMMDMVWVQVKQLRSAFLKSFKKENGRNCGGREYNSYMFGVLRAIFQTLDNLEHSVSVKRQEWGLVAVSGAVVRANEAEAWFRRSVGALKTGKASGGRVYGDLAAQGRADGSKVQLRSGVNHSPTSSRKALA